MMKIDLQLILLTTFCFVYIFKLSESQNVTRLRGTMIDPNLKEEDFRVLASWNANHVRWQLNSFGKSGDNATVPEYEAWLQSALQQFDTMLPVLRELGIKILLDLHARPGGRDPQGHYRIFTEKEFQDCFLSVWEMMANRYKNETQIMGYDLLNEPDDRYLAPGVMSWRDLAIAAVQRIRAIDTLHPAVVEASPVGGDTSLPKFEPLPFDNIIYSFHMYDPWDFTAQNLYGNDTRLIYYPGVIDGEMWNKDKLRSVLQPTRYWQTAHNVSIHIGEFSAIRWAPGNSTANYLSDLIDLYEEYGWDWDYHAFREFQGWDVEMIGDFNNPHRSPVPTDRQLVLMEWFKKNQH